MTDRTVFLKRPGVWLARAGMAFAFAAAVAACDTADYTVDWFEDDDEEETVTEADGEEADGADGGAQQPTDQPFPNLSSVPERPGPPEIRLEAVSIREGLTADKNNARYTDQTLRSQTANVRPRPRVAPSAEPAPAQPSAPTPAAQAVRPSAPPPPPPGTPAAQRPVPQPAAPQPAAPAQAQVAAKPAPAQPVVSPSAPAPVRPQPVPEQAPAAAKPETVARAAPPPEPVTQDTAPRRARPAPPPVAAAAAPAAPAPQVPVQAGTTTLVATIYFADGQTALTTEDLAVLRQVMDIQRQGGGSLRVVGHSSMSSGIADPTRRRLVNFKVCLDRATIVAQSFRDMGLPAGLVAAEALGDAQPIYSEATAAGAAGNRRAEIFLDN